MKIGKVKEDSIKSNSQVFGNIFKNKRKLEARIKGVHRKLDAFQTPSLIALERDLQQQYNKILFQE